LVHLATERPSPRQPSGWRGFNLWDGSPKTDEQRTNPDRETTDICFRCLTRTFDFRFHE
jgi:hypothetical protein